MNIAFCSSEVYPYAKTGGLADVCGSLPLALAKKDCQVKVFLPFYKGIAPQKDFGAYGYSASLNVEYYFVKNDLYFKRGGLYQEKGKDYPDNLERFSFYCRKTLELIKEIGFKPDLFHLNDWQTALIAAYLKTKYLKDKLLKGAKVLFTIHNLAYQGIFENNQFKTLDLDAKFFNPDFLEFYGQINLLKGGVVFADMVNTVSPTYAKQIQTPGYGCGLEGVLRERRDHLTGILNAIDLKVWNPKTDPDIFKNYDADSLKDKAFNKEKLQKSLGFRVDKKIMLLGMVTRLVEHKGLEILTAALEKILKKHQVVILGQGEDKYQRILKNAAKKFPENLSFNIKFDEPFAHKIYAASDCFLMPSRFEPCGLSQMISYRYGTLPIVHKTGGLADSVKDISLGGGGFVMNKYSSQELLACLGMAEKHFSDKNAWQKTVKKVINYDFSWKKAAARYIEIYKKVII